MISQQKNINLNDQCAQPTNYSNHFQNVGHFKFVSGESNINARSPGKPLPDLDNLYLFYIKHFALKTICHPCTYYLPVIFIALLCLTFDFRIPQSIS